MRARLALRAIVLGLAIALPVAADAPTSGPDRQYEPFISTDRIIQDRFTKLTWDRPAAYAAPVEFDTARTDCEAAGGRLPSLKELLTLVDEEPHSEYDSDKLKLVPRYIDRQAFPKTPAEAFWTSSMQDDGTAWTVDFGSGMTKGASVATDRRRVRCVSDEL